MASIANDPGGSKRIFFVVNGKQEKIHLGKVGKAIAREWQTNVEKLLTAAKHGTQPEEKTAAWLAGLHDELHEKLARKNLVAPRTPQAPQTVTRLGEFIDGWIKTQPDMKQNTLENMQQARRWLVDFFGADCDMQSVTPAKAREWRAFMLNPGKDAEDNDRKPLGDNTIRRHIGRARQLWNIAIDDEVISGGNPFRKMSTTVRANKNRQCFITRDATQKLIDKCPNSEWKLIIALSRFGGLRCPSEHLALKWADIHWDEETITVWSPKTEHHAGGECRIIPLWPELRPLLEQVMGEQTLAEKQSEHVISIYREKYCNIRTMMMRIIHRAGLKPWPKPFHNLRASCQTELAEIHPEHKVCKWIGNSQKIFREHYAITIDADFKKAARNTAYQTATTGNNSQQSAQPIPASVSNNAGETTSVSNYYPRQDSNNSQIPPNQQSATTKGVDLGDAPDELAEVVAAWPKLSAEARARVLAIVRAAVK